VRGQSAEKVGVFVARAWLEPRSDSPLRVRITHTVETANAPHRIASAATLDGVCDEVRAWLEAFLATSVKDEDAGP